MRRLISALAAATFFFVSPLWAQSLTPLTEMMNRDIEASYPLIRCAAFYQASTEWAGSKRMGSEFLVAIDQTIKNLMAAAILIRINGSGSMEATKKIALRDTRNIANLYLQRFETNYASTGEAWGGDPLWISDSQLCKTIAERVKAKIGRP